MTFVIPLYGQPDFYHPGLQAPMPQSEIYQIFEIMIQLILLPIFLYFVVLVIIALSRPRKELFNHWNVLMYDMKLSTLDFYDQLESILSGHGVESMVVEEKDILVGGVLSQKRKYLRVTYRDFTYDICGAPFGKSFFVSYWMYSEMRVGEFVVLHIPFIGKRLHKLCYPTTYYYVDTCNMFHRLIHDVIIEKVDEIAEGQKLEKLSENQKIPKMKDVFKR